MITTLIIIGFVLYSVSEGMRDALYYHFKIFRTQVDYHEHSLYVISRAVVVFSLCLLHHYAYKAGVFSFFCMFVGLSFIYSFIHDSIYFTGRNHLDSQVYPKTWRSEATNSNALMNFNLLDRLLMFFIGVALLTLTYFIQ